MSKTGFSVVGALLFGGVFVAVGVLVILVGLRIVAVDPGSVHAPYWVLVAFGVCFATAGLMVWGMGASQQRHERHRRAAAKRHGASPALEDHPWDTRGYTPPRWGPAVKGIAAASFFTLFLSMFNWWAWIAGGPWMVRIIVSLFDLILVLVWWKAVLTFARAVRFGGSRLAFGRFPYPLRETLSLRWMPPRGIGRAERGSFTLRCVEEYDEERGSGKNRSRSLAHDELCAEVQAFDAPQSFVPGRPVELRFNLPTDARPTALSADRPVFWELEVKLARPGLDFEAWYLVPVYER